MIHVVTSDENEFARYVKETNCNIYVWGSGVMLQICFSHILLKYNLVDNVVSCTESDLSKIGRFVKLENKEIPIVAFEEMVNGLVSDKNAIIVVTCSYYKGILNKLDSEERLDNVRCLLLPMLYIENKKKYEYNICSYNKEIPRIIHYCWFGNATMPERSVRCIESWKKMCPDYKIMRWDESNIDVEMSPWVRKNYNEKRWAYVSDYVRAWILYNYGGYYFDVDVELIEGLDNFTKNEAFVCFEKWPVINTGGGCGSVQGFWYWKECMELRDYYQSIDTKHLVPNASGFYDTIPIVKRGLKADGSFQQIDGLVCFPSECFHPFDYVSAKMEITNKTCGIHYFNWTWADKSMRDGKLKEEDYNKLLARSFALKE